MPKIKVLCAVVTCLLWAITGAAASLMFSRLFGSLMAASQRYPLYTYQQYPQPPRSLSYGGYASYIRPSSQQKQQQQQLRPTQHSRSYKDICHMVNTNGFTNPGNVPKCPMWLRF